MTRTDTLMPRPSIRSDRDPSRSLVSLIEVPEVKVSRTRHLRPHAHARVSGNRHSGRPYSPGRKRRLRREIRIAGCALLVLAPLFSACTLGWSTGPVRVLACSINEARAADRDPTLTANGSELPARPEIPAVDSRGVVVLSIEPAAMSPATDSDVPVIFPGYVLPDDSLEGSTHEGS
jgi:hypothetical protein